MYKNCEKKLDIVWTIFIFMKDTFNVKKISWFFLYFHFLFHCMNTLFFVVSFFSFSNFYHLGLDDFSASISSYFETNGLLSVPVGLKCKTNTYSDVQFPAINSQEPDGSVESCDYEELFDWLGSVSCDCIK